MTISRCNRCEGRAIIIDEKGDWRCVVCNPRVFKWNKKEMKYE